MNILHIDSSARRAESVGRVLSKQLVDEFVGVVPTASVTYRDIGSGVPFVSEISVEASFTPEEERTPAQRQALAPGDELIEELENADIIVLSVPIYNFSVPAAMKAYIDLVARARRTFQYSTSGPVGLLRNKVVYLVVTSGGTVLDSEIDFATPYLRQAFAFLGIDDVRVIDATQLMAHGEEKLANARTAIATHAAAFSPPGARNAA